MDSLTDYYQVLGVSQNADIEVIKAAYRALAKKYHPDLSAAKGVDASTIFKKLNEAYEILSDPARRRDYDAARQMGNHRAHTPKENQRSHAEEVGSKDSEIWSRAIELMPNLSADFDYLTRVSPALAGEYRRGLLNSGKYHKSDRVRDDLLSTFMMNSFGKQKEIQEVGLWCLLNGHQHAARELGVLGTSFSSSVDSVQIVDSVIRKFNLSKLREERQTRLEQAALEKLKERRHFNFFVWGMVIIFFWPFPVIALAMAYEYIRDFLSF